MSEHAQKPRQRAAGPPQAASGELTHIYVQTSSMSADANVPTNL